MTEQNPEPEPEQIRSPATVEKDETARSPSGQVEETSRPPSDQVDSTAEPSPNSEAASWRRRLRAEEAKTAGLTSRVESYEKAEVERLAGHLQDPSDIWLKADLASLRNDEGGIDPARVGAALQGLAEAKPYLFRPGPDLHQGVRRDPAPEGPSFGDLLKRERNG